MANNQTKQEHILLLRQKANALPLKSGVYIMKNKQDEIIYVGKAKILKNRVVSYFRAVENHTPKVYKMVMNVDHFDTIITNSEFEALVLECSLIKQHTPRYNILLKDAKGYTYIRISKEEYPKITLERNKQEKGEYLGPYMSYFAAYQATDSANKLFKLPTCSRIFPRDIKKSRPCLNFHINACMGVCTGKVKKIEYIETLNEAVKFLKGNTGELLKEMQNQMIKASDTMQFEKAAKIRDKIKGIKAVKEKQIAIVKTAKEQDAIAVVRGKSCYCFAVIKIRDGRIVDKNDFLCDIGEEENSAISQFLKNYYYQNEDIPPRIYLNTPCLDKSLIEKLASDMSKKTVSIYVPTKGENLKIVQTAEQNARESLALKTDNTNKYYDSLQELSSLLGLKSPPKYIESYDISNLGEDSIVSGMIVFENAMPKKKAYKRFEVKNQSKQDDYTAMRDVIKRRFLRYKDSLHSTTSQLGTGFDVLPDLILLDGGIGHVNTISKLLKEMEISVPVFGMVKNSKHRTRAISSSGGEIDIASNKGVFSLVTKIQDEVHRFSVAYLHAKLKSKTLTSTLAEIDGIGKAKANNLLAHFKGIENIKIATVQELEKCKGIGKQDSQMIYEYFHLEDKIKP